jgi:hypothetical protein
MLRATSSTVVIPAFMSGIHLASCSGASGWMDPGDKHRDDT